MAEVKNRRPLASRQSALTQRVARWLAGTSVTPNQISVAGMVAAALAGGAFWASGSAGPGWQSLLLILAALACQIRLLCNLFDGMVAVEAGRATPDGAFWNEFPDRVSDLLILAGIGYGIGEAALGWAAVSFAILTAYLRELGVNCGLAADFSGPMAKQHRMAVVTLAALLAAVEPLWGGESGALYIALLVVAIGAAVTALGRSFRLVRALRGAGR